MKSINRYHFHYINENDLTFMCLTERSFPKRTAFAFVEDIKNLFYSKFKEETYKNAIALSLGD